jgi:hypothetical protein
MPGVVITSSGISHFRTRFDADGVNSTFTITHNLGWQYLIVQVWDEDILEVVIVDIDVISADAVNIIFAAVPTSDKNYIVHIIAPQN